MTTETDPALTGAAYDLASAGYVPMPDPEEERRRETIGSDTASLREAAAQCAIPPDEPIVRKYTGADGETAPPHEAVTLARASRDYAAATAAEQLVADSETSKVLAERVDALRAAALANDPDAAEFYGIEPPRAGDVEASADAEDDHAERRAPDQQGDAAVPGLDPELAKALAHPQVRHAIEEQLGEVERARQSYAEGLAAATQVAQASFLGQFPELAAVAPENMPAALAQLAQQDPEKFERVRTMVAAADQLLAQQHAESHRQAELNRRHFEHYARTEDVRFETMMKGEPREMQAAVGAEILAAARESGIDAAELGQLLRTEPLMRHAAFQKMMYDAGRLRLMMKARDAAIAKPLPPVVRPGTARTRSDVQQADLRTLSAKLSNSGDIKDAVALYHARKSSRR